MGVVAKGANCNVDSCESSGIRSLNRGRVEEAGLRLAGGEKKAVLCREHYREWKKKTREERSLERARYDKP